MGDSPSILKDLAEKRHVFFAKLSKAKRPVIILGAQQFERKDGGVFLSQALQLSQELTKTVINNKVHFKQWNNI